MEGNGRPWRAAIAAGVLVALVPHFAAAQMEEGEPPSAVRQVARIVATDGMRGHLATPVCGRGRTLRPTPESAATFAVQRASRDPDDPLVLDLGGLLTPSSVTRFAARQDPSALAELVDELGYGALAFGLDDLSAPRAPMLAVAAALRAREIPMIMSNLRCDEEDDALCDVLVDASDGVSVLVADNLRIGVLSVLRGDALSLISPDRARGLHLDDPREVLIRDVPRARAAGANMVVAVVDLAGDADGLLTLAASLPEEGRPDLIFGVHAGEELLFARPSTVYPVLVGAAPADAVEVRVRESDLLDDGYEMLAQPLGGRGTGPAQPVREFIDRIGQPYCDAWGRPLRGARTDEPIDVTGLSNLIAGQLREIAGADVAVVNVDSLDPSWRPADARWLTASDLFVAIQYDEPIFTATVNEAWLQRLVRSLRTKDEGAYPTPGLTYARSGINLRVKVGGHTLVPRANYRIVSLRYLTAGGDGVMPPLPPGASWQRLETGSLRDTILEALEEPSEEDPRERMADPTRTTQWVLGADADLSFSGSSIGNPVRRCRAGDELAEGQTCDLSGGGVDGFVLDADGNTVPAYTSAALTQLDTLTFGFQLQLSALGSAPDWTWDNDATFLYRTTRAEVPGEAVEFAEAADIIRVRSSFSWRGLRAGGNTNWYVPDPSLDLFIESELTPPDDRDWHWFLTRPTLGLRFALLPLLQLRISGGVQFQPFDPALEVQPGFGANLTLRPWDFLKTPMRAARVSFELDYFIFDIGEENRQQLRGTLDSSITLAGPLQLALQVRMFLERARVGDRAQDAGASLTATANLRFGSVGRVVMP